MLTPCGVVHSLLSWVVSPVVSVFIGLFPLDYKTSVCVSSEYVGLFYENPQTIRKCSAFNISEEH